MHAAAHCASVFVFRGLSHIPPNYVVECVICSSNAARGENLQGEPPIGGGDASAFDFHPTVARVLGSTLMRHQVVQVGGSAAHQHLCCCGTPSGAARYACMDKPLLDLAQWAHADFYALIGRVSLLLVAHNIDAITVTMFLREIVDAGGDALSLAQVRHIASHYVDMASRHA